MAWDNLKQLIRDNVYENHNEEISGQGLQNVLIAIVDRLTMGGYAFKGYATPLTIITPTDGKVAYFGGEGTYDFGITIAPNELALLLYDGSWSKQTLASGISQELLDKLVALPTNAELQATLSAKANIDGYYETLGAGYAKNLLGNGRGVLGEFSFRPSGGTADIGTGIASLDEIRGNSVVLNQLVKNGDFSEGIGGWTTNSSYSTLSVSNGILTQTLTAIPSANYDTQIRNNLYLYVNGHKYFFSIELLTNSNADLYFQNGTNTLLVSDTIKNKWHKISTIATCNTTYFYDIAFWKEATTGSSVGDTFKYKNYKVIDLTQMFGAGNEPTTTDDPRIKWIESFGYIPYNEGQLLNFKGEGLKTIGVNAFAGTKAKVLGGSQYYILGTSATLKFAETLDGAQTDITPSANLYTPERNGYIFATETSADFQIALYHSGGDIPTTYHPYEEHTLALPITSLKANGVTIFPDGMKSAGTAHDELYGNSLGVITKAIKRIGVVDLGSLDWTYVQRGTNYMGSELPLSQGEDCVCAKYSAPIGENIYNTTQDKVIGMLSQWKSLLIKDSAYTDATAFKAAMQGVMLYYELATPIEYTLDEPIPVNYNVDDWGTEMLLPQGVDENSVPLTTPLIASIVYAPNVVDAIRNLPKNFASIAASGSPSTINNLLTPLKNAGKISSYTITWDSTNNVYNFTIS